MESTVTYPVNEIFTSIQGEGSRQGTLQTFIRFARCNLACSFCDTDFSISNMLTQAEILFRSKSMPSDWVVFTGGEPTTVLTEPLTSFMAAFYELQMETNGTHICPTLLDYMSHVSISPKKFSMELSHWQGWYDYILQRIAPPSASKLTVDFRFSVEIDELVDVDLMGAQSHAHAITWCQPLDYSLLKALRTLGVNMWMSPIWHSRTAPRPDQIEKCVHLLGTPLARDVGLRLNTQIHKYLDIR